jgi:hypothetical protein
MTPMGLQVSIQKTFQQREWKAQRAGWVLIALMLVAALVGLLGPGPLSWATAQGADGSVQVEYQRFTHREADDRVSVTLSSAAVTGDSVDVELDGDWVQAMDITGIHPQPQEQTPTPYGVRLSIPTEPGAEVSIQITFRPSDMGPIDGGVRFNGETVVFDQFVYP